MDAQISSKDQEIGGDEPPSELPTLSEKDKSQESSDHVPLRSPLQLARLRFFEQTLELSRERLVRVLDD
ncbi:hypothetical protein NUH16_003117 [Penicillium rubens]|nr:hypothetical protein NUH16_003117 [Penicillium rubens]